MDFKILGGHKKLCTSIEILVGWMANKSLPWAVCRAFMYGRLISLDKHTGVRPVVVGGTWRLLFSKCVLEVTVPEDINVCQYDHLCVRLKVGVYGIVRGVQAIGGTNFSMENWVFLLMDAKNAFK